MIKKLAVILLLAVAAGTTAQKRKVENLPFIDQRRLHFGFSVGTHLQDMSFTHSGFVTESGESWYMEIPSFSPGFNVGLVGDLYLWNYFNLRFTPTLYFGNKTIELRESNSDKRIHQDIKSNYLSLPVSIRYSAKRMNNYRPYLIAGVSPTLDISKKKNEMLQLKSFDTYLEIGLGCDIYLPFFKLIPELKFCIGLADILAHKRNDLRDPLDIKYTQSVKHAYSRLVVLSFYFE